MEKDNAAIISRLQWPNDPLGSFTSAFSLNGFNDKINSSFGLSGSYELNLADRGRRYEGGLHYGYRVLVLESGYLCLGLSANYSDLICDVDAFTTSFDPKANDLPVLPDNKKGSSLSASGGILFHTMENRYIGFSMRDIELYKISADTGGEFRRGRTFSFQARTQWNISRQAAVLPYFMYEHYGQLSFDHNSGASQVVIKPYSLYFLQLNLYQHKTIVIGVGYKFYPRNYGSTNYRIAFFPGSERAMLGYSFDTKPFIQNDKIHWISSHEISFKYLISTN